MAYSLINLPDPALEAIFSYLTFDEIAKCRVVCKRFNEVCGHLLNRGFYYARPFLNSVEEKIKKKMPRKSSERNESIYINHQFILWQIDIELRRLNAIYSEYLEAGKCYFIPGKVLDKIYSALIYLQKCDTKPRINLSDLENLSVMATEHFQDHILPVIRYRKTVPYLANSEIDFSLDQFSVDMNTSTLFSVDEQPRIGFPTDEQCGTTRSGSRDYANENSEGYSAVDYSENYSSPDEYAANEDHTDEYPAGEHYMAEYYAGDSFDSQLRTTAVPEPGCSWMNEPNPKQNYNKLQRSVSETDPQFFNTTLRHHSVKMCALDHELRKQASLINELKAKISQMENTQAENHHKYLQLEKMLELLCNNYAIAQIKGGEEIGEKAGPSQIIQNNSDSPPQKRVKRKRILEESDEDSSE